MVVESQKRKQSSGRSECMSLAAVANPMAFSFSDSSRSAFSPYKPSVTVLTNLQRGNTKAKTNPNDKQLSIFQLAAKGELAMEQILGWDNLDGFDCEENELTALMWASSYGQCHTCEDLLKAGAAVDVQNRRGQTALHFAAKAGYPEVAKVLISFGADINCPDEKGNTALIFASRNNHPLTVALLLSNGADFMALNDEDSFAYVEASNRQNNDVRIVLENHMKQLLTGDVFVPNGNVLR